MIKLEETEVIGWEHAIRGMRNPMNSWEKSDSEFQPCAFGNPAKVGQNDYDLMTKLRNAGTDHRKFMRMIAVYVDITAPLYWWKEFDTYKVGTVANSCSTMHKIHDKEFTLEDFSHDHLSSISIKNLERTIEDLNVYREVHNNWNNYSDSCKKVMGVADKKDAWWQIIQLLPSSYNQKRTVMLNYEVLANMYKSRRAHKLDEWREFCQWIKSLPYSELITGNVKED